MQLRLIESLQGRRPGDDDADISALAESADGKLLAWGDDKGTVRLYSFPDKTTMSILDLSHLDITAQHSVRDLTFNDKGQLWWVDVSKGIYRAELVPGKDVQIEKVAVAADTNVIRSNLLPMGVLSGDSKSWPPKEVLKLLEVGSGKLHESDVVFPGQRGVNEVIQHAVRSPDGKLLMAVADGDAALLSLPDMKILRRFGQKWGESAAFSPSSKLVALGTDRRGVFVWEAETGKLVKTIPFRRAAVIESVIFASEDVVYTGGYPLCRVDLRDGTAEAVSQANARVLLLSRSGKRLFVGTFEGGVEVFELPPGDATNKNPTSIPASGAAK